MQFPSTAIKKNDAPSEYDEFSTLTPSPNSNASEGRNGEPATTTPRPAAATYPGAIANPAVIPTPVQPRNGARQTVPIDPKSVPPRSPATAPAARANPQTAQPLTNRAPASGGQPVGTVTTNAGGAATGVIRGRRAPVNTPPQNGAKDY